MLLWITSCEGNRSSNGKVLPYKILDQAPLNTKLFRVNRETKLRSFNITERPETHTNIQTKSTPTSYVAKAF